MNFGKAVQRPGADEQLIIRNMVHQLLMTTTSEGAKAFGMTGASFVVLGVGVWIEELMELDASATKRMLDALTKLFDPSATPKQKEHAEKKRRAAVEKLFRTLDLEMAPTKGSA